MGTHRGTPRAVLPGQPSGGHSCRAVPLTHGDGGPRHPAEGTISRDLPRAVLWADLALIQVFQPHQLSPLPRALLAAACKSEQDPPCSGPPMPLAGGWHRASWQPSEAPMAQSPHSVGWKSWLRGQGARMGFRI